MHCGYFEFSPVCPMTTLLQRVFCQLQVLPEQAGRRRRWVGPLSASGQSGVDLSAKKMKNACLRHVVAKKGGRVCSRRLADCRLHREQMWRVSLPNTSNDETRKFIGSLITHWIAVTTVFPLVLSRTLKALPIVAKPPHASGSGPAVSNLI